MVESGRSLFLCVSDSTTASAKLACSGDTYKAVA